VDRLTPAARDALDAYRESLALGAKRVDRNWASIESRTGDAVVDAPPRPMRARGNAVAIVAAVVAVIAAAVALAVVVPTVLERRDETPSGAAAPYEAIDDEAPAASVSVQPSPAPSATPRASAPPAEATPTEATPIEAPAPPALAPAEPTTPRRVRKPPAPPSPARPELDAAKQLVAETALLRRARAALRDGDTSRAIAATDEHRKAFPDGELAEEIAFVRLSALCAAGRIDEGEQAAQSFATRWPSSPLRKRAAQACVDG
jgi:hypothetical protein